jgi:hypothetical protein
MNADKSERLKAIGRKEAQETQELLKKDFSAAC